uniref:Uncharacterized protein n=1 Tax=Hyaloperonospora arabidopsidis (strain Emoy2) TaxID=559515 RepID=M4C5Z4_HYAAE
MPALRRLVTTSSKKYVGRRLAVSNLPTSHRQPATGPVRQEGLCHASIHIPLHAHAKARHGATHAEIGWHSLDFSTKPRSYRKRTPKPRTESSTPRRPGYPRAPQHCTVGYDQGRTQSGSLCTSIWLRLPGVRPHMIRRNSMGPQGCGLNPVGSGRCISGKTVNFKRLWRLTAVRKFARIGLYRA